MDSTAIAAIIVAIGTAVGAIVTAAILAVRKPQRGGSDEQRSDVTPALRVPNDPNAPLANEDTGRFIIEGQGEHRRDLEEMGLRVEEVRTRVRSIHDGQKGHSRSIVNIQLAMERIAQDMESLSTMQIQHDTTSMQVRQIVNMLESQNMEISRIASRTSDAIERLMRMVIREEMAATSAPSQIGNPRAPRYQPPKGGGGETS
jgi:hypothetical protein